MNKFNDPNRLLSLKAKANKGDVLARFELFQQLEENTPESKETLMELIKDLNDCQISLHRIDIKDFRVFRELSIKFDRNLTVLIGNNGAGKTSIVIAITKLISWVVGELIFKANTGQKISAFDIHVSSSDSAQVCGVFRMHDNFSIKGSVARTAPGNANRVKSNVVDLRAIGSLFRIVNAQKTVALPFFAVYPVGRSYFTDSGTRHIALEEDFFVSELEDQPKNQSRFDAYDGFDEKGVRFSKFVKWYCELENQSGSIIDELRNQVSSLEAVLEKLQQRNLTVGETTDSQNSAIMVIKRDIDAMKEQYHFKMNTDPILLMHQSVRTLIFDLLSAQEDYNSEPKKLYIDRSISGKTQLMICIDGLNTFNIHQLSDGQKVMLALVGDLMRRMIILNPIPVLSNPFLSKGIVVIDEIDLHFHPKWQQVILPRLQSNFPNIQFIITTHSPQVLTTVRKDSIRILEKNSQAYDASMADYSPLAQSSSDALSRLMDTHPTPHSKTLELAQAYELLVRSGLKDSCEAKGLLKELNEVGYEFQEANLIAWEYIGQHNKTTNER